VNTQDYKFLMLILVGMIIPLFVFSETKPQFDTDLEKKLSSGIPNDFDALVRLLYGEGRKDFPLSLIEIPDGRSLVKKNADFKDPRILPVFNNSDLYMGYAPKTKQVELIAWNSSQGRYEFYVIDQMGAGSKPNLIKPSRSLCISCHQNGGPIFSRSPWSETHAGNGNFMKKNELMAKLNKESQFRSNIPLGTGNDVTNYNIQIRNSAARLLARKICEEFCDPEDADCKLRLLEAAMKVRDPKLFTINEKDPTPKFFSKNIWPKILAKKISLPSSVIPDRDPLDQTTEGGVSSYLMGDTLKVKAPFGDDELNLSPEEYIYSEDLSVSEMNRVANKNKDNKKVKWEKIIGIKGMADPLSPRPPVYLDNKTHPISFLFSAGEACFGFRDETKFHFGEEDLFSNLKENPLSAILIKKWPPQLDTIEGVMKRSPDMQIEFCKDQNQSLNPLPQKKIITEIKNAVETKLNQPIMIFRKSCAECHDGPGAFVSGYKLPLFSLEAMKNYKKDLSGESLILKYLRDPSGNPKMPPKSATHQLSEQERRLLLESLK
jgi:hypothetical protein